MNEHAMAANARLLKAFPDGFALNATHHPHVSMLQQIVRTADLDSVYVAARAVFGLLQRVPVSADEQPREGNAAGIAAWGLVRGLSSLFIDGLVPETYARGMANQNSECGELAVAPDMI